MLSDRNISMCAKCQPSGMNSLSLYRICGQKQRDLEHKTVRDREWKMRKRAMSFCGMKSRVAKKHLSKKYFLIISFFSANKFVVYLRIRIRERWTFCAVFW